MADGSPRGNKGTDRVSDRIDSTGTAILAVGTETAGARARRWLSVAGLRPTRQRMILAELLVGDGRDRHVTAEALFDAAGAAGQPVALATVYNTLHSFRAAGLLSEVMVNGGRSYFDTNAHDHPHFFWEDGEQLTDAPTGSVRIEGLPDAPEGTEIARVDVVIRLRPKD